VTEYTGPPLTSEEREAAERLQKRVAEENLKSAEEMELRGKYKIQVWIRTGRSVHKPLGFSISFWESGKRLHGGGDESMWVCRRRPKAPKPPRPFGVAHSRLFKEEATPDGCGKLIAGDNSAFGYAVCPHCGVKWDTEHIADSIFYTVPVERAAEVIANWFRKLDHDADIYVKYRAQDVRVLMMAREFGVRKARQLKGLVIYTKGAIIQDTVGGATLEACFKALLLA